ncbi:hypothetical protein EIL87_12885 [Saccharopolyspora rhizosphaerae]|uniref:Ribulose 1,5-bisphosphate carboxylase large subunit n=1 Tax=Saccharopolyspora rhizosphaerae TaxID=2492662 RepID=A0A426JU81_9PSEU|nr:hypothetical protein [Saccharopolyspora rhizosphaerae]RRO16706.1 hypothetical protein EIL87_12885 [Saccharopolyspora rhizosphaerae]
MLPRVPTPSDVLGLAKSTVGWATHSASAVVTAPARVLGLLGEAEDLVGRISKVVDQVEELVQRAGGTVGDAEDVIRDARAVAVAAAPIVADASRVSAQAEAVVGRASGVADEAAKTVEDVRRTSTSADELLNTYAPTAKKAAPLLDRFVEELSEAEVDAAIRLVDELPQLTEHVLTDILPILRTLDRVGPEIHELLEVTYDVRRAIAGIPGFQFFRRRGEDKVDDDEPRPQAITPPN